MRKIKQVMVWGFCILILPRLVFAGELQEEKLDLGEVAVTGTKTERKTAETPAAIHVITKEEIKQSKGWNLGEVLESLPGIQSQSGNGAYDTHIIIRGAGAKANYGVREIMIMVDGVPITDPDSLTRLDLVDTSLIERIEVVKGPNSTLYGANAAGGVINIITKDSLGYQGLGLKSSVGSYNSNNFHLSYGGQFEEKFYYFVSAGHRSSDSWREHNEFSTNQLNGKFDFLIDESSSINLLASYSEAFLQLPGSLTEEEFEDDPNQVSSTWPNAARDSKTHRYTLEYEKEFNGGYQLKTQFYAQYWEHYHPVPRAINVADVQIHGGEIQGNIPHEFWGTKNVLTLGYSHQVEDRESEKFEYEDVTRTAPFTSSDDAGQLLSETGSTAGKWGVYLQESLKPLDGLIIDAGIRYDEVRIDLDTEEFREWGYIYVWPGSTSYFGYKDARASVEIGEKWEKFSPRVGLNYALMESLNVYGSVGTGFQTPTQGELRTNTDLKPQESINYEIGLKGRFDAGHSFDLSFFHTSVEDEIIKLMDRDGDTFFDNAGETEHMGVEVSGRFKLIDGLYLGGSYAYSDFTFDEFDEMEEVGSTMVTHSRDGNRIQLVPVHQYSYFLDYHHPIGVSARVEVNSWEEYFVDAENSDTYKGFTVVGARLGYDWKNANLFVRVDNAFDKKYAAEVSKSYGTTRFSPGAPRTWVAGISYKF
jgi:iron complex outermembrane receptor protein